jgi:hypothetical protein
MPHYRLRVQLIHWYGLIVPADSSEAAIAKVEALAPRQIVARGRRVHTKTGLADPSSVQMIERK